MDGKAIFLSAIAHGTGMIDGVGDPAANVFYDGVWSLNDEPYHSLPDVPTPFELAAPATDSGRLWHPERCASEYAANSSGGRG